MFDAAASVRVPRAEAERREEAELGDSQQDAPLPAAFHRPLPAAPVASERAIEAARISENLMQALQY